MFVIFIFNFRVVKKKKVSFSDDVKTYPTYEMGSDFRISSDFIEACRKNIEKSKNELILGRIFSDKHRNTWIHRYNSNQLHLFELDD